MSWELFEERPARSGREIAGLRARNAELEALEDTLRSVSSTLCFHDALGRLLDRALVHVDSKGGSILLSEDDGQLRVVHARGLPPGLAHRVRVTPGEGIAGRVAATGSAIVCDDIESDARFRRPNRSRYASGSFVSVPFRATPERSGVINVSDRRGGGRYDEHEVRLLRAIARWAPRALRSARRYEALQASAERDAVTGLHRAASFAELAEREVKRAQRYRRPLSLALVEIDDFARWLEALGPLDGERALAALAAELSGATRGHDLAGRLAPETFGLLLPETDEHAALEVAARLCARLGGDAAEAGPRPRVSAGVASTRTSGRTAEEMMRAARHGLLRAQELGGGRVCPPPGGSPQS